MIGKFIWHTPTGDHVVELHWVDGQPAWLTDNENLEYALNLIHGYSGTNHPDSPGYPYWWQALKGKKVTVLVEPPREVDPPPGGVF